MEPQKIKVRQAEVPPGVLPRQHPTSLLFLDETGTISADRFFGVGCLKLSRPSDLLRDLQTLRDKEHRYKEIHFTAMTRGALGFYKRVIDLVAAAPGCTFSCFIADRTIADPVQRFGTPWLAYEKLATQLLIGSIKPYEVVTLLADNYSTPPHVQFEEDVRYEVNRRLGRLAIASACRLDSKAADPLQIVDLLTAAVAFEFRESAGLANAKSPKGKLAEHFRTAFGIDTALDGCVTQKLNIALHKKKGSKRRPKTPIT